jgi:hypothetical protein
LGRLTSGQAAKLCGVGRVEFLVSLSRLGIPASNLRPDDAELEIAFARDARAHRHQHRAAARPFSYGMFISNVTSYEEMEHTG